MDLHLPVDAGRAGGCHSVRSRPRAGLPRAEDRCLSASWHRNMGSPAACGHSGRQEPPETEGALDGAFRRRPPPPFMRCRPGRGCSVWAFASPPQGGIGTWGSPGAAAPASGSSIQKRFCRIRCPEPAKNRWWLCVRSEQRAAMPLAENLLQTQTPGARRCARRQQEEGSREKGRPSRGRRSRLESLPSVHALGAPGGVPLAANRSSVAK